MMFTIKMIESLLPFKKVARDADLLNWARNEYKFDSEYAYNFMKKNGTAPDMALAMSND